MTQNMIPDMVEQANDILKYLEENDWPDDKTALLLRKTIRVLERGAKVITNQQEQVEGLKNANNLVWERYLHLRDKADE